MAMAPVWREAWLPEPVRQAAAGDVDRFGALVQALAEHWHAVRDQPERGPGETLQYLSVFNRWGGWRWDGGHCGRIGSRIRCAPVQKRSHGTASMLTMPTSDPPPHLRPPHPSLYETRAAFRPQDLDLAATTLLEIVLAADHDAAVRVRAVAGR